MGKGGGGGIRLPDNNSADSIGFFVTKPTPIHHLIRRKFDFMDSTDHSTATNTANTTAQYTGHDFFNTTDDRKDQRAVADEMNFFSDKNRFRDYDNRSSNAHDIKQEDGKDGLVPPRFSLDVNVSNIFFLAM